jgi:hypothetical protein
MLSPRQSTSKLLMIRPANFGSNVETLESNAFQQAMVAEKQSVVQQQAVKEFDNFVYTLRKNQVDVLMIEDTAEPAKTDAVFPNNWISMHADGRLIIYPMESANRRLERRKDILDKLKTAGFQIKALEDLSIQEEQNHILEGTGSMVFDHLNRKVYACLSSRTHEELLKYLALKIAYEPVVFHAKDKNNFPVYHTNVMMCIGSGYAVICAESITDQKEREKVLGQLRADGLKIIEISMEQMYQFAGNMLEVSNRNGEKLLVMSQTAFNSLEGDQKRKLSTFARLLAVEIPTIEKYGGGSARCMMAEIFLRDEN